MTRFALGLSMFTAQRIFRIAIVIKGGDAPIFFGMTGFAFIAEIAFMTFNVVIGFMTGNASCFKFFLIQETGVTGFAFSL